MDEDNNMIELEKAMDYIARWAELRDVFLESYWETRKTHSDWSPRDARATVFGKCVSILNSMYLNYWFHFECINDSWLSEHIPDRFQIENFDVATRELHKFTRVAYIQELMLAVESSFRAIMQEVKGSAYNAAADSFSNIATMLLNETGLTSEYLSLCDLLRLTRNTVHNNSVYLSKDGKDKVVIFRGSTFNFHNAQKVRFVGAFFILDLGVSIHEMLSAIIRNPNIVALNHVEDLSDSYGQDWT